MSSPVANRIPVRMPAVAHNGDPNADSQPLSARDLSDEELLSSLRSGSADGMRQLFDRYCKLVLSIGLRVLRERAEAEDLVQDVFLYIFRKRSTIHAAVNGQLTAWMVRLSHHKAFDRLDYLKSRGGVNPTSLSETPHSAEITSSAKIPDFSERFCRMDSVARAMRSLTDKQRTIILMRCYEGYEFEELSEKIGESYVNVRQQYYRGLEKLRQLVLNADRNETLRERSAAR
jgi:RNA polymerase sigma-70 factor (ECF subfamily)